jgi:hypothetical protein
MPASQDIYSLGAEESNYVEPSELAAAEQWQERN